MYQQPINLPRVSLRKNNAVNTVHESFCKIGAPIIIIIILVAYLSNIGSIIENREKAEQRCIPALTKSMIEALDHLEPLQDMGEGYNHIIVKSCRLMEELRNRDSFLRGQLRNAKEKSEENWIYSIFLKNKLVLAECEEGRILHEEKLKDNIACMAKYSELFSDRLPLALNTTQLKLARSIMNDYFVKRSKMNIGKLKCKDAIEWCNEHYARNNKDLYESIKSLLYLNRTRCIAARIFDENAPQCEFKYNIYGPN